MIHRFTSVVKNEVCFSAATSACEKGHDWPKALQLLERMFDEHWTPDVVHFNSVAGTEIYWVRCMAMSWEFLE